MSKSMKKNSVPYAVAESLIVCSNHVSTLVARPVFKLTCKTSKYIKSLTNISSFSKRCPFCNKEIEKLTWKTPKLDKELMDIDVINTICETRMIDQIANLFYVWIIEFQDFKFINSYFRYETVLTNYDTSDAISTLNIELSQLLIVINLLLRHIIIRLFHFY